MDVRLARRWATQVAYPLNMIAELPPYVTTARSQCVPEILSVSCDLRIFVDDTADQIASLASERVEVNNGAGQRPEWCSLPGRAVRPVFVVVVLVLSQRPQETSLIPDQGAAGQFPSASADPPLHDRVSLSAPAVGWQES